MALLVYACCSCALCREARAYLSEQFENGLADLFAKGGFEELTKQELSVAFKNTGVANGMNVLPPNPDKLEYKCYCRGRRDVEVSWLCWCLCGVISDTWLVGGSVWYVHHQPHYHGM